LIYCAASEQEIAQLVYEKGLFSHVDKVETIKMVIISQGWYAHFV